MVKGKDVFKHIAIIVLAFCAAFMCTNFTNYMFDLNHAKYLFTTPELQAIYYEKMTMSKTITACAGGMLGGVTLIVLTYSISRFIQDNSATIGVLKALGYSEWRCALNFSKFCIAVFVSATLAYLMSYFLYPLFYDPIGNIELSFGFHFRTVCFVIILPTLFFIFASVLYARFILRKAPLELINSTKNIKIGWLTRKMQSRESNETFMNELKVNIRSNNLLLIFFVGFSALAYSTQVQMAFSIREYATDYTAPIILISLGFVLGITTLFLALSFVVNANKKYISMLKAFGYTQKECYQSMLGGYRIVAYIGFIVGTVYKYLLMNLLIDSFAGGDSNATVLFDYSGFILTLVTFVILYELVMCFYLKKINKVSINEIMQI